MPDTFSDQSRDAAGTACSGTSRALVPLTLQSMQRRPGRAVRPDARFVAHLIATAVHAPQTRPLQRAAPGDGAATYGDASVRTLRPAASGLALSRVA